MNENEEKHSIKSKTVKTSKVNRRHSKSVVLTKNILIETLSNAFDSFKAPK